MKTLHEFVKELKLVDGYNGSLLDPWGSIMKPFFEACAQLYKRGARIPDKWQYNSNFIEDPTDPEGYWFELFENTETQVLLEIGEFCYRYTQWVKAAGLDY